MEPMSDASSSEQFLMKHAWNRKLPINGSLELLPLCNMNCDMCYVRLSREEMKHHGRIRTASEWLSLGEEMQKSGVMFLLLTGGEPLLHPEFKEIYLGLKKMGFILTLNTNATLIDEEWADFFAANPPRRINITLYGASSDTYHRLCHYKDGFDRVMRAIKLLQDRNLEIRLGMSVTPQNKDDFNAIFAIRKELGIFTIADTYMVSASREREHSFNYASRLSPEDAASFRIRAWHEVIGEERYPEYAARQIWQVENILPEDEAKGVSCYAGNCSFAISWLGDMHPCVTMTTPSANVFERGFSRAWEIVQQETAAIRTNIKCQKCNLRPLCKYCAGNNYVETGSYAGVSDYICRYAQETYRLLKEEVGR